MRRILSVGLALLVIAALSAICYLLVTWLFELLGQLNPNVAAAIIGAFATVMVSVLSLIVSRHYERKIEIERRFREKKIPVYEALIEFTFRIFMSSKSGEKVTEREMLDFLKDFTQQIMVWGSDDVLVQWVEFRKVSLEAEGGAAEPVDIMLGYERLVRAIRKDLGHNNAGLDTGDLLSLFINDVDSVLKKGG